MGHLPRQQDAEKGALGWELETRVQGHWLTVHQSPLFSVPPAPELAWKGALATSGFVLLVEFLPADTATGGQRGEDDGRDQREGENDDEVDILEPALLAVLRTHVAQGHLCLGAEAADEVLGGVHIHSALVQLGRQPAIATAAEWIPL